MKYRESCAETEEQKAKERNYMGLGLTSRKNLCINPEVSNYVLSVKYPTDPPPNQVSKEKKGKVVDARCRDLTNSAVCEKGRADPGSVELCDWHEVHVYIHSVILNDSDFRDTGFRKTGAGTTTTSWYMDTCRRTGPRQGERDMSVLCCTAHGRSTRSNTSLAIQLKSICFRCHLWM